MVRHRESHTLVAHTHEQIRGDILQGAWEPGTRLQPVALAKHYDASTTVIREALVRLSSQKIVVNRPQRGFFVQDLSLDQLADLTMVRVHCDTLALRLAIERASIEWESSIMTTHHRLARTPRRSAEDPEHTTVDWTDAHRAFHLALIEGSGVPSLVDIASSLFDATELYRRWAAPSSVASQRSVEHEHVAILDAALERETDQAVELLRAHYERSRDVILASGLVSPTPVVS